MLRIIFAAVSAITLTATTPCFAVVNLLANSGFEDPDGVEGPAELGDGWGVFGAAGFNAFFGDNAHASLFPDTFGNSGGVFQSGIAAQEGRTYQFDLLDTRIEASFDANLRFGVEFYAADDTTKLGESIVSVGAAERLALPNVDGGGAVNSAVFSASGTAPVGASIVRPIVLYDDVNNTFLSQPQANVFIFDTYLSETPTAGGNLLKNPGFGESSDPAGGLGEVWGFFGNTGANDFFGGNAHASLFADTAGNSGGLFQQSILAEENTTYEFELSDVRIEANFDARLQVGLEYYGSDDFNLIGSDFVTLDTSTTGDGLSFSVQGTPSAGTVYVRPVVLLDEVNPIYLGESDASAFIFETVLRQVVALSGDYNSDGVVDAADYTVWRAGDAPDSTEAGYNLWRANYGASVSGASQAVASVPEPSSMVLITILCGCLFSVSSGRSCRANC